MLGGAAAVASTITSLQKQLEAEKELRDKDVDNLKQRLADERALRESQVQAAVDGTFLKYAFTEEYKPWLAAVQRGKAAMEEKAASEHDTT
jgi:hypothetical protein